MQLSFRRTAPAALVAALVVTSLHPARADEADQPENRFVLSGYGFTNFVDMDGAGDGSFTASFVPIFLYRVSDRFLFEAELEFEFGEDAVETEVEYAQIDWIASDTLTVVAGKYLTPFGSFIEKLHPAWINKLPTFPLPYQHGSSLIPFGQTGLQLRGGIPLGDGYRRITYSLFASNGLSRSEHRDDEAANTPPDDDHAEEASALRAFNSELEEDDEHADDADGHGGEEAELIFLEGASANSNGDLGLGGRLSVFPTQGLELATSYLSGTFDEAGQLDATASGFDVTYHHDLFDLKAEWIDSKIERGLAEDGDPLGDQDVKSWYIQPSLRLSVIPVYAFNRVELVGRLAELDWSGRDQTQTSIGLNYYINDSSILRVAWERLEETGLTSDDAVNVMLAVGF